MSDIGSLNMLYRQKEAQLASLREQQQAAENQLGAVQSDASTAQVTCDNKKISLSEATTTLSNFIIPDIIDEPDRASFTTVNDETGEEVFDEASYNAENNKYLESVRVHDEAVKKKEELERIVDIKTSEVSTAEANFTDLVAAVQNNENELSTINNNMDVSMSELTDLESQIKSLEAQEEKQKAESQKPNVEVVGMSGGRTKTVEMDPETGLIMKETITDASGKVIRTEERDSEDADVKYRKENRGNVTVDTVIDGGKVTSKFATSDSGNVAEYDGRGNTKITVKAGESADLIYNKFYGAGEENQQNRENLVNTFRQKAVINGQHVAADYNPSDAQLKQYFYMSAGFNSDGNLKSGGGLQAGQSLSIPTEIHPDDKNLQGRDAVVEKARGNDAEKTRQNIANAQKLSEDSEASSRNAFRETLMSEIKLNAAAMKNETQELNNQQGSHNAGNISANYRAERMQNAINDFMGDDADFGDIAHTVEMATGAVTRSGNQTTGGTLSVHVSEEDIESLYQDVKKLSQNPNDKELASSVEKRLNQYTMRDFVGGYNQGRAENNLMSRVCLAVGNDLLGSAGNTLDGMMVSGMSSFAAGNDAATVVLDTALGGIPLAGTVKTIMTDEAMTKVYEKMGNSKQRFQNCFRNISSMDDSVQRQLAALLRGKTPEQQASIIAAYSKK